MNNRRKSKNITIHRSDDPRRGTSERPLRRTAYSLGVAASVFAGATNFGATSEIIQAHTNVSDIEKNVSDYISDFVNDERKVNCGIDDTREYTEGASSYETVGYVQPFFLYGFDYYSPVMTLAAHVCNDIDDIHSTGLLDPSRVHSLYIAAHESAHIEEQSDDEALVSCRAIAQLAVQLTGMRYNIDHAAQLVTEVAGAVRASSPTEYVDDTNCQPGGSYTLDLEQAGLSPIIYLNKSLYS